MQYHVSVDQLALDELTSVSDDLENLHDDPDDAALRRLSKEIFDPTTYAALHADLREAVTGDPNFDLPRHYIEYGLEEGRAPSLLFDVGFVQQTLQRIEGRAMTPREAMVAFANMPDADRFVPNRWFRVWSFLALYAERHPTLCDMADYEVFSFYLLGCRDEAFSPNGLFSEEAYRARYPDVAEAIEHGHCGSGFLHFVLNGAVEGRENIPGYGLGLGDAVAPPQRDLVLGNAPDLAPLVHWFDECFYLSVYEDVHSLKRQRRVGAGLEHFIVAGAAQGRVPHPAIAEAVRADSVARPIAGASAGSTSWDVVRRMALLPPPPRRITMQAACAMLERIAAGARPEVRRRTTDALWPYVDRPPLSVAFDASRYFAVNPDVARALNLDANAGRTHWEAHGFAEHRPIPGTNIFGKRAISLEHILHWHSGVNFFGPLTAASGLGQAARGYLAALRAAGVPVVSYDVSSLLRKDMAGDLFHENGLPYSINFFCLNADQVLPFVARYGNGLFDGRANVAAWVWELPAPRPEWRAALSAFDLIVVPSEFTRDSFALFTDLPIRVVPYVVDAAELRQAAALGQRTYWIERIEREKAAGKRVVMSVMDASSYTARKGFDLFTRLALHIHALHPDRFTFVLKTHSRDISLGGANHAYDGALTVIDGVMPFNELCRLKALADVYVSPHRSEGFGLNIFESLLLGVPVLCSDFAGPVGELGPDYPYLVPGSLTEVGRDMGPYREHAVWFEPDFDAMADKLLEMLDPAQPPPSPGALADRLAERLSAPAVGRHLREALEEHCAYRAAGDPALQRFLPLAEARRQECYTFANKGLENLTETMNNATRPFFSIITPTYNTNPEWLTELHADLQAQGFAAWEWCISDDGSTRPETIAALRALRRQDARIQVHFSNDNLGIAGNTNLAVGIASGVYLVIIDHDDRVRPDLLALYRARIGTDTAGMLLYCDEDKIDSTGTHCEIYHKPDFSPDHLMSCMYVLHCLCVRKEVFLRLGGYRPAFDGAQDHDFVLRVATEGVPIHHIDAVLYHWRKSPGSTAGDPHAKNHASERGRLAVADHLHRLGLSGTVEHGVVAGTYRVRPALPADRVSINILTGCTAIPGSGGDTYVERFVRSILANPPAPDFELRIVVDTDRMARIAALRDLDSRVSVVPYSGASAWFNFAEKANAAVRSSAGDRVVLLNDDMLARDGEWLAALLEMLEIPGVGVVGGRLLRDDATVQHAGIVLGVLGLSAHVFENMPEDDIGYNCFTHVIRNYSAVTGAMLAFRRATFDLVGGFDEAFPVDFNDVDFCLKVNDAGLRVVYTPFARLIHYESRSARRLSVESLDARRFAERWTNAIARDPFYNVNLSRIDTSCSLGYVAGELADG